MDRQPVSDFLPWLQDRGYYANQIRHHEFVEGQPAEYADIDLSTEVALALSSMGIPDLYTHQVEAINSIRDGENAVVATPTASGKTLCYSVPAFERAVESNASILYIAPYKALINDQADFFGSFAENLGMGANVRVGVQTGDTPQAARRQIKDTQPEILCLTLDQIHMSLLPYAHFPSQWKWLFQTLDMVVIDEVHEYRGVFGSHASLIFRRLNRLCDHYNADPQYVCCSATIGNPVDHAATVTGRDNSDYSLVDTDTSASGDRHWLLWNPPQKGRGVNKVSEPPVSLADARDDSEEDKQAPADNEQPADADTNTAVSDGGKAALDSQPTDPTDLVTIDDGADSPGGERLSNHAEAVNLFCDLVAKGYQTLVFSDSRQGVEQNADRSDRRLRRFGLTDLADDVHAYHAALKDSRRRSLEEGLQNGDVRGVWSTSALEVGIDIGTLDVVILDGYPGTTMSTFQRAGRAGRGTDSCLVVLVGSENPLDQHLFKDPETLFTDGAEHATVNPQNRAVLSDHLICAAAEHYLSPSDEEYFGDQMPDIVTTAEEQGLLSRPDTQSVQWDADIDDPAVQISIRDIADREIDLVWRDADNPLSSLPYGDALRDAHEGAVYHHQKNTFRVTDLDLENDVAQVESVDTTAFTQSLREKDITINSTLRETVYETGPANIPASFEKVTVSDTVTGYLEYSSPNDDSPEEVTFEPPLPPTQFDTSALHFTVPEAVESQFLNSHAASDNEYLGALHAIEHAMISLFPTTVLCDRRDIGGLSTVSHHQTETGTIFIHDAHSGGAGLCRGAYEQLPSLLTRTKQLIGECSCSDGCPSCIHSPHCGNGNNYLQKDLAYQLLDSLVDSS